MDPLEDGPCSVCGMMLVYRTGDDPRQGEHDTIVMAWSAPEGSGVSSGRLCRSCNPPWDVGGEPDPADFWKGDPDVS